MIMGVADGSVLYDKLHKRFHPVGELNKDVTYPQFYDYFNCLQVIYTVFYGCTRGAHSLILGGIHPQILFSNKLFYPYSARIDFSR